MLIPSSVKKKILLTVIQRDIKKVKYYELTVSCIYW